MPAILFEIAGMARSCELIHFNDEIYVPVKNNIFKEEAMGPSGFISSSAEKPEVPDPR